MTDIPVPVGQLVGVDYLNEVVRAHWRKLTAAAATNTVTETDLLNGEILVAAGALVVSRGLRVTAWGDWLQNSGGNTDLPRWKVKLGATPTTVLDTGSTGSTNVRGATQRYGWKIVFELLNLGATNAQLVWFEGQIGFTYPLSGVPTAKNNLAVGEGIYQICDGRIGTFEGANVAAIDTTAAMAVQLTVINPSATSTETKLLGAIVEAL